VGAWFKGVSIKCVPSSVLFGTHRERELTNVGM
jgi:hypothetical protein